MSEINIKDIYEEKLKIYNDNLESEKSNFEDLLITRNSILIKLNDIDTKIALSRIEQNELLARIEFYNSKNKLINDISNIPWNEQLDDKAYENFDKLSFDVDENRIKKIEEYSNNKVTSENGIRKVNLNKLDEK